MSRRKQSNPKPLKNSDETFASDSSSVVKSDDLWEGDNEKSVDGILTSTASAASGPEEDFSASEETAPSLDTNLRCEEGSNQFQPAEGNYSSSEAKSCRSSASPTGSAQSPGSAGCSAMAAPNPPEISRTTGLSVSAATSSYLAAALKANLGRSSAASGRPHSPSVGSKADKTTKEEPSSPGSPSRSSRNGSPPFSTAIPSSVNLSSLSLGETMEATRQHLTNMIQGLPLLSSVLPALQCLAPSAVSPLSPVSSSCGGLSCICGIKFFSSSNLEAHRMFYCTQRHTTMGSEGGERKDTVTSPTRENNQDEESGMSASRILRCPHCPYSTTHKLSLNGHMNIHTSTDESLSTVKAPIVHLHDPRASDRYCSECDIQFSSMKTFRVHKTHYCQTRHVLKGSKSPGHEDGTGGASMTSMGSLSAMTASAATAQQPILALPTNPVLLVPYSLVAGAQLLPPHILPQVGAAFVLPNGQVQPLTSSQLPSGSTAAISSLLPSPVPTATHVSAIPSSVSSATAYESKLNTSSTSNSLSNGSQSKVNETSKRKVDRESPLDLTTKRPKLVVKSDLFSDEEKENRETNSYSSISPVSKSVIPLATGEFEGKLLSSPRPSPSDNDERTTPKSPRPASAAPSLASPRGLNDSPRPSTSAVVSNARSPSHSSPGAAQQSTIPSLPHVFSNHLVNSLESFGSTLPLASLQCLQSLQNVPRDLALKLMAPDVLINGLNPIINPPVIVKKGEAKCNECNIVFYKEESLQIHKKHYCAARETSKSSDDDRQSARDRSPTPSSDATLQRSPPREILSSAASLNKESTKSSKSLLQFICTACGIKFSSPDNLTAHQTYYCPKREGSSEDGISKGLWRCPRCRVVMTETMQAAHQCVTPATTPSHGWKCPCCPVLSPTAAAAQKHLETHAGIKAFRCTICGYRGNTLRGMRTHIRMHFEKRSNDLQEENFIACILEEEEHRSKSCSINESRMCHEASALLAENPALSALLGESGSSDQTDPSLSCVYCPFMTPLRSSLLQHLAIAHKLGLDHKITQDLKSLLDLRLATERSPNAQTISDLKEISETGTRVSPPVPTIKLEPEVKVEVHESEAEGSPASPKLSQGSEDQKGSPQLPVSETNISNGNAANVQCYCHVCNISFTLVDSYVAHKRFYCGRPQSNTPPETTVQ